MYLFRVPDMFLDYLSIPVTFTLLISSNLRYTVQLSPMFNRIRITMEVT